ncbi:hypothetical protein LSAT2_011098 [Lamellibrachia satsuma]|nr:hypothetical protein LSAT2_011098 [Lamellibrachia satsuma]
MLNHSTETNICVFEPQVPNHLESPLSCLQPHGRGLHARTLHDLSEEPCTSGPIISNLRATPTVGSMTVKPQRKILPLTSSRPRYLKRMFLQRRQSIGQTENLLQQLVYTESEHAVSQNPHRSLIFE